MNDTQQTHPTHDDLAAFSAGKLNAVESDEIERHLAECESCCQILTSLPEDDTLVSLLRDPQADTSVSPDQPQIAPTMMIDAEQQTQPPSADTTRVAGAGDPETLDLPGELREHPRYRIVELLGHGGMGDVYRAQHKVMDRPVALKVIKPQLVQNDAAVRRFRREVQAAAQLRHPNIVTAHDAEQAGDLHYLVMEFVDGVDLDEVIRERGPLPVDEACDYIRQAAEGLQHANDLGMVHRDIKPHNLMIERQTGTIVGDSTVVKILDFGLANFATETAEKELGGAEYVDELNHQSAEGTVPGASILHQLTQMGTMMGTPDYIAPEQAQDAHTADIRSDIYSLGCTFYTLLTGKAPFGEGSVMDKVKAHTQEDAPPLSDFRDDVPAEVEAVLLKMMAKDPAERYQTPAEVAAALEGVGSLFSDRQPLTQRQHASMVGKKTPDPVWFRRPLIPTAVATLFLAIAAAAIFYIQTDNGVVRVEVTDPSLKVTIAGQTITMDDNGKPLTIRAGEQKLIVRQNDSNFELVTDSFQLHRGDDLALKVDLLSGEVVVSKDGERFGAKAFSDEHSPTDQIAAEWTRLAGRWQGAAFAGRTMYISERDQPKDNELIANADARTITLRLKGRGQPSAVDLDPTATPKQIDLTSEAGYLSKGIYKLDGDDLTICLADAGQRRPKEFHTDQKTGGGGAMIVFRRLQTGDAEKILVVFEIQGGKQTLDVKGPGIDLHGPYGDMRKELPALVKKYAKATFVVDVGPKFDTTSSIYRGFSGQLEMELVRAGARVRYGPTFLAKARVAAERARQGKEASKNEFRVVVYERNGGDFIEISGPGIEKTVDHPEALIEELLPIIRQRPGGVTVLLDAGEAGREPTRDEVVGLQSIQSVLITAGAAVKLDPRLSELLMDPRQRVASDAKLRMERSNALKEIGLALQLYHEVHGCFPPGNPKRNPAWFDENGRPHLSWRVHILPYLEEKALYDQFRLNEPWDSEHNEGLHINMPKVFKTVNDPKTTTLLAVVGEGTAYEGKNGLTLEEIDRSDGRSNTALVVDAGREQAVPWTKPEDLPFDTQDPIRAFGTSHFGDVFLALMADGFVQSIPYDTAPESLRALFTRAGGDTFDPTAKRTTPLSESVRPNQSDGITLLHEFSEPKSFVRDVAFSPNGRLAAAVSNAGRLFVWEIATKRTLINEQAAPRFRSVAFSPEGRRLVASGGPQAWVWDLLNPDEKERLDFDGDKIDDCVFLNEEICVGVDDGGTVHAFRSDNGFPRYTVSGGSPLPANDGQWFAVYRPDAIAAHAAETGELLGTFKAGSFQPMWRLGMSGGGFRLAAGSQTGDVIVWETDTGEQVHRLRAHVGRSCIGGFSAFRKYLVSHGDDGTYRVWDLDTGKQIRSFPFGAQGAWTHYNMRSKFLSNRRLLFVDASDVVHIWDVEENREIARHQAPENSARDIAVSPSGKYLLTAGGFSELSGELEDTGDYKVRLWQLPQ